MAEKKRKQKDDDDPHVVVGVPALPPSPTKGDAAPATPQLAPVPFRRIFW
jgi:hypothetical protein